MGFLAEAFDHVLERRGFTIQGIPLSSDKSSGIFGMRTTRAGVDVTADTALQFAAFWDAVSQISGTAASLPLHLYRRLEPQGRDRAVDDARYFVAHDDPNPEATAVSARQTILKDALVTGNGFAELTRNTRTGKVKAMWQLPAAEVEVERDIRTDRLFYRLPGTRVRAPAREMVHLAGMSPDGVLGYSVVHMARESIGRGLAADAFAAAFYGNGAWPGITIHHPGELGPVGRKELGDAIRDAHGGPAKAFRALVLDQDMKVTTLGMPLKDAEFLGGQRFSVEEIARWFNLRAHRLKVEDSARVSNHEADSVEFYSESLRLWLVRFEQELNRKLLTREERRRLYFEHAVDGLLRGDVKTRHETYAVGRQWGYYSADDVLELEGRNPLPDGQGRMYMIPENMTTAESVLLHLEQERQRAEAGEPLDGPPRPPPGPPPPPGEGDDGDPDPDPDADRAVRIRTAHRRVALEAAERAVKHTANAARRAAGRGEAGLRAWLGAGLEREQELVARWLLPAITACLSLAGDQAQAPAQALAVAQRHGARSRDDLEALVALFAQGVLGQDLANQVDLAASRWEQEWPGLVLEQIEGRTDP